MKTDERLYTVGYIRTFSDKFHLENDNNLLLNTIKVYGLINNNPIKNLNYTIDVKNDEKIIIPLVPLGEKYDNYYISGQKIIDYKEFSKRNNFPKPKRIILELERVD